MLNIIENSFYILVFAIQIIIIAFIVRIVSHMIIYSFQYKQLLWNVKLYVARKIDNEFVEQTLKKIYRVTWGANILDQMYDDLCNRTGKWSFLLRIMDCVYCSGMYVSIVLTIISIFSIGLSPIALFFVPVLSFFFIEKI